MASRWTRAWAITGALSVSTTVSYGILYYAFAAFLVPIQRDLGWSTTQLTGAFSAAVLISAVAGIGVGRYLDRHGPRGLMTAGSVAGALLRADFAPRDLFARAVGSGLSPEAHARLSAVGLKRPPDLPAPTFGGRAPAAGVAARLHTPVSGSTSSTRRAASQSPASAATTERTCS